MTKRVKFNKLVTIYVIEELGWCIINRRFIRYPGPGRCIYSCEQRFTNQRRLLAFLKLIYKTYDRKGSIKVKIE